MRIGRGLAALALVAGCGGWENDRALTAREAAAVRMEVELAVRHAYDLGIPDVAQRMLDLYADSGRIVSATAGSVTTTRDSLEAGIRYFWNNVGSNMRGPRWEWDELFIDVLSSTSAAVTGTYHIPHRNPRNEPHVLGGAMTLVMVKRDGQWKVIQEHLSDLPQRTDSSATRDSDEEH